jgi:LysR family transcriptional regulator, hydrogen peroxide-inducible genes activator
MNLQQLEYIAAVDHHRSFSKAAESCFITQATLSTMVKKLEQELGVVIFDRKTNPVLTTECGKALVDEARKVLFHSNNLRQLSAEAKGRVEGELRIGIIPTVAGNLLHRILPVMLEKYPMLRLTVHELTTRHMLDRLKAGELDAGILSTPVSGMKMEEEVLYREKLMVYGHVTPRNTRFRSPRELAAGKIWLLEQGNCLTDQVISVCALNTGKLHSNLTFSPGSFDSLLNIVDHMKGLTLIPELFCLDLPEERKKNVRNFQAPYPVREISMVYHRPYAKLRLTSALAEEIRRVIAPQLETHCLKEKEMLLAKM